MNDEQLKQILKTRAEREVPATMDMRSAIRSKLTMKPKMTTIRPRFDIRRIAVFIGVVLATLTGAYVIAQSLLQPDPGVRAVQAENLVTPINQSQVIPAQGEVSEITVTLDYAYADSNRVVVGYRLSGDAPTGTGIRFFSNPHLKDSSQREYMWLPAADPQQANDSGQPAAEGRERFDHSGIMSFDAAIVTDNPAALAFTFRLEVAYATAADPNGMVFAGEVNYDFTVPFNTGRQVTLDQAVTAGGIEITLNQMVITPSLTRIEMCSTANLAEPVFLWRATIQLAVNGTQVLTDKPAEVSPRTPDAAGTPCYALNIRENLVTQTGTWVLTISSLQNTELGGQIPGSWEYSLTVQ